jgi:hypothetical protein
MTEGFFNGLFHAEQMIEPNYLASTCSRSNMFLLAQQVVLQLPRVFMQGLHIVFSKLLSSASLLRARAC